MSSFTVNAILEKTENRDKDFRYMATSDLLSGACPASHARAMGPAPLVAAAQTLARSPELPPGTRRLVW